MSHLLKTTLLGFLFLCCLDAGAATNTAVIVVSQTPESVRAMEGAEFTITCTFNTSRRSNKWFVEWYKDSTDVTAKLSNGTDGIIQHVDKDKKVSSLTVRKAKAEDSGTYLCEFGFFTGARANGSGTQVTIQEITDLMVNQTPANFSDFEGSELTMNCTFKTTSNHSAMSVRWYRYGTEGLKEELVKGWDVLPALHLENGFASLTLKNMNLSNAGNYLCEVGSTARNLSGNGTGTLVTIETVDLLVNQTPAVMNGLEGENLTIECRFKVMKDSSATYRVTWYKSGLDGHEKELKNGTGGVTTALDSLKGLASLTLIKVNRNDSGLYRCDFGKNGRGDKTRVTIPAHDPGLMNTYIVSGAVAGALLLLLLLCILLWRWRPCSKEPVQKGPEAEMNPVEPPSPPADEVTYADLNFLKRDAKETEDIYAKVKIRPKQREDNATSTNINPHHR
ncbi:polymeric immunoglobulin receptor-like [Carettochelys insculpta]|uniref:polymeric immunoglobulin receptor-like n=1 Tax=Carettochelys insculpta TaxID=44489 RepID=UPI003EC045CA